MRVRRRRIERQVEYVAVQDDFRLGMPPNQRRERVPLLPCPRVREVDVADYHERTFERGHAARQPKPDRASRKVFFLVKAGFLPV